MNEIEIIRSQLQAEQTHAAEVANACAAAAGGQATGFSEACVSYLVWVLARFEERDQTLAELLSARRSPATGAVADEGGTEGLIARPGTSREALARLERALAAGDTAAAAAWREFARFFNEAWLPRRAALEQALAARASVAQWRAVCAIDADAMLEERSRYARVLAQWPSGLERKPPPAPR